MNNENKIYTILNSPHRRSIHDVPLIIVGSVNSGAYDYVSIDYPTFTGFVSVLHFKGSLDLIKAGINEIETKAKETNGLCEILISSFVKFATPNFHAFIKEGKIKQESVGWEECPRIDRVIALLNRFIEEASLPNAYKIAIIEGDPTAHHTSRFMATLRQKSSHKE